jgi:hypothetical protein
VSPVQFLTVAIEARDGLKEKNRGWNTTKQEGNPAGFGKPCFSVKNPARRPAPDGCVRGFGRDSGFSLIAPKDGDGPIPLKLK